MTRLPVCCLAAFFAIALVAASAASAQHVMETRVPRLVPPADPGQISFLVVAPDRGFLGNDEARDAFHEFSEAFRAELAFLPWDGDPMRFATPAIERLQREGASQIAVLPLFLTDTHPLLGRVRDAVAGTGLDIAVTAPFGESYLAEEVLIERLGAAGVRPGMPGAPAPDVALLVIGSGAVDEDSTSAMETNLSNTLERVGRATGLAATDVVVVRGNDGDFEERQASFDRIRPAADALAAAHDRVLVVPWHLGSRMDSMMDLNGSLRRSLSGASVEFLARGVLPDPMATVWMAQEANRRIPPTADEIGYVLMPHGADIDWNESIRQPLAELTQSRLVEYAFSMADPVVLDRAVSRLEERGARAIVLVRVFAQAASFLDRIEYLMGLGDEPGMSMGMGPPPRVRSAAVFATLGGLEDQPAFAEALASRARALSEDPSQEAVLLLGHGAGSDEGNAAWLENLESIASQMQEHEPDFAAFHWANWREDWPEAREEAEAQIHSIIEEERALGRTVLAIPARMTGTGPSQYELSDIDGVRIGTGFAPHPLFARWISDLFAQGDAAMRQVMGWQPDERSQCDADDSLAGVSLKGGRRCAR